MSRPGNRRALNCGIALMAASMALGGAAHSALAGGTEISLQPRIWYNFYSDSQFGHNYSQEGDAIWVTASTAYELPFYGGTVTVKNPAVFGPGTLAITVLNGDARDRVAGYVGAVAPTSDPGHAGYTTTGVDEVHRFDAEALFILPMRSNATLLMGGRYIGFDWNRHWTSINGLPVNAKWGDQSSDAYYAELGVGLSAPITESGRHILFANLVGLVGLAQNDLTVGDESGHASAWSGGVDANVGYAYQLSDAVKLSARYRLFARSQLEHWSSQGSELMHGPEVGLTYTIGASAQPLK